MGGLESIAAFYPLILVYPHVDNGRKGKGRFGNSTRWMLIWAERHWLWFVPLIYCMDRRLRVVHFNWRCCRHYRFYGDKRADRLSSKSISESERFKPCPALDRLVRKSSKTKGGAWGLLNHLTSDGSFRKSMLLSSVFFSCTRTSMRRGKEDTEWRRLVCVCKGWISSYC